MIIRLEVLPPMSPAPTPRANKVEKDSVVRGEKIMKAAHAQAHI